VHTGVQLGRRKTSNTLQYSRMTPAGNCDGSYCPLDWIEKCPGEEGSPRLGVTSALT
jgi:hypothetical protein